MKKFFLVLAAVALFVACKSPAEKAQDYADDIAEAIKEGDTEKAEEIAKEAEEWYNGLDEDEKKEANEAMKKALFN